MCDEDQEAFLNISVPRDMKLLRGPGVNRLPLVGGSGFYLDPSKQRMLEDTEVHVLKFRIQALSVYDKGNGVGRGQNASSSWLSAGFKSL